MANLNGAKKIKVMFIIDYIYGITGGTENQLVKLINNLDVNKYDLYLLCQGNTPWIIQNIPKLKTNVKVLNYNVFNHMDPRNIIAFFQMTKYIKKVGPDIVINYFKISYILGVFAARLAGVRKIISTRRDYGLWLDKRSIYLLRFANRFVKAIITNSYNVKQLTSEKERFDNSKIDVIYNGIDVNNFIRNTNGRKSLKERLGIASHNKVVGIVATFRPMKQHKTFIRAANRVLGQRQDVNFILVGDGPLRTELEAFASELKIAQHTHFVGMQEDVKHFLSIFDIGVNCSANEGLSNAVMEYMANGVPCIVSKAGGNLELIENGINGYTFELDNDKELAELIITLLEDKHRQSEFISKSKDIILNQMTLEKMVSSYDTYFTEILAAERVTIGDKLN